jgi:hypothetical protein
MRVGFIHQSLPQSRREEFLLQIKFVSLATLQHGSAYTIAQWRPLPPNFKRTSDRFALISSNADGTTQLA